MESIDRSSKDSYRRIADTMEETVEPSDLEEDYANDLLETTWAALDKGFTADDIRVWLKNALDSYDPNAS